MRQPFLIVLILTIMAADPFAQQDSWNIDLSGQWQFRIDPLDTGVDEKWFSGKLPDSIHLPGSMAENNYGGDISVKTKWTGMIVDESWFRDDKYEKYRRPGNVKVPFWLQPKKHYVGAAWYQKEIEIPRSWQNKIVLLHLERCHWETRVWIDDKPLGMQNSLSTPHEYILRVLTPGIHRLTVRVDNTVKIDVGINAHSVSDHTQTNWNGMVGTLELRAVDAVRIDDLQVFPDVRNRAAQVKLTVRNDAAAVPGTLTLQVHSEKQSLTPVQIKFDCESPVTPLDVSLPLGNDACLWDEFGPNLYQLTATIEGKGFASDRTVTFGMRELTVNDRQILVNGRKTFLRGTLECAIFPLTGYPAMDVAEWMRILQVAQSHGLNHLRFHSWCPPEAAFRAADRLGVMLAVEATAWAKVGDGDEIDRFLYEEGGRILKAYGNHPSFCFMAYGNEPDGKNQQKYLGELITRWRKKDSRCLYTCAAGWPQIPESDYHSTPKPRIQAWGAGLKSIINSQPPRTDFDFTAIIEQLSKKPVVSHEIGQWCAFPNLQEIDKYTGVLQAKNFEIFKETLEQNHMGHLAKDLLIASGKLQALCYKADIEAALRTPNMAGFQLLDLHDFPGQGTALVGVLDAFWQEKGYISPHEYRRFCNSTVPLARMKKLYFLNSETFVADIEVAHFGPAPLKDVTPCWAIRDLSGKTIASGQFAAKDIPIGNGIELGQVHWPLKEVARAAQLDLEVKVQNFVNDWDFWVFPAQLPKPDTTAVFITQSLDEEAVRQIKKGGTVFIMLPRGSIRPEKGGKIGIGFSSIFWNTAWTNNQMPHTLGILCNPDHPAFAGFPTESHSNYQWWDACAHSDVMILDDFAPELNPIVRVIDDWFENRRLGLVFEARIGNAKILVSSIDFVDDMADRPAARQLLYSLQQYVCSNQFNPGTEIDLETLKELLIIFPGPGGPADFRRF